MQTLSGEVQISVDLGSIYASSRATKFSELHDRMLVKYSMYLSDSIDIFHVQGRLANLENCRSCHNHLKKKKKKKKKNTSDILSGHHGSLYFFSS
jgi:hypothetical protein